MDYDTPDFYKYKDWIRNQHKQGCSFEKIKNSPKNMSLKDFLIQQEALNDWAITAEDWFVLVNLEEEAEKKNVANSIRPIKAILTSEVEDNSMTIPDDPKSSWQLYKEGLLEAGFKQASVDSIEDSSLKILRRLNIDTAGKDAVKGLVVGNVQSGKTANMAALMAMAADWGWNFFIVLSGTIENLRKQTQERLFTELNSKAGNLAWISFDHLGKNSPRGSKLADLHLEDGSNQRYINVCLKNSGRLKQLIQWLQSDINNQERLKILLIDDEADQAGINSASINSAERSKINRYICSLVNGNDENHKKSKYQYKSMNYIGYTATPYSNILNEAERESLYPRDFITTLEVSDEYFGPQQIFGLEGADMEGLSIVRTVDTDLANSNNDITQLKNLHDGTTSELPGSLKKALCWFLCSAACYRIWKINKPVSMLVHTSQKTTHHDNVANAIQEWLTKTSARIILGMCNEVWREETREFNKPILRSEYKQYGRRDSQINDYPDFASVQNEISNMLSCGLSYIKLDDESKDLKYNKGIHLCVDNCKNTRITEDGFHLRLAYPENNKDPKKNLDFSTAFIVVGGATLSRGLTIQGLTTTYFLRSSNQADSLMQMGRWFGYRKNYELLQRLWITPETEEKFEFLSTLDYELREEISNMESRGIRPSQYGPRVKNTPNYSFLKITAKNKMKAAQETDWDFSGTINQTFLFENRSELLRGNIKSVEKFVKSLGAPDVSPGTHKKCNEHAKSAYIWKGVKLEKVKQLIFDYKFHERLRVLNNPEGFFKWLKKATDEKVITDWNIVMVDKVGKSNEESEKWKFDFGDIHKIKRTRRYRPIDEVKNTINIGVLLDPVDQYADVDLEGIEGDTVVIEKNAYTVSEIINDSKISKFKVAVSGVRKVAGLESVPLLIIYMVDKKTVVFRDEHANISPVTEDLVGLSFYIPGNMVNNSCVATVSIHMPSEDDGDMNGTNDYD